MKHKLLEMVQVTVWFHTSISLLISLFLLGLSKMEMVAKISPRVPKLGYLYGRVQKLSSLGDTPNIGGWRGLSPINKQRCIRFYCCYC